MASGYYSEQCYSITAKKDYWTVLSQNKEIKYVKIGAIPKIKVGEGSVQGTHDG